MYFNVDNAYQHDRFYSDMVISFVRLDGAVYKWEMNTIPLDVILWMHHNVYQHDKLVYEE